MNRIIGYSIRNPEKILIVKPSSLGDIVHSLPFLNAVKAYFPDAAIHWVIARGFEELLQGHPMIEKLWIINKDAWKRINKAKNTFQEIKELFRGLKREQYDLVVDLQGLLRSGIITAATRAKVRIGFKESREGSSFFYTHRVESGKAIHAVDRYLGIAEFLGCDITSVSFPFPSLRSSSSFILHPSSFDFREGYAVIVPGARWKTKRWSPENFGKLASLIPLKTVVVGSKGDRDISDRVVSLSNGKAVSLAGKTSLKQLVETIAGAKFVVSNDSGPMHIAAALGVPVFAIFGPTDSKRTGPYGHGHTIIKADAPCAPCFKRTCDDMKCISSLSVEKVYEVIKISSS